EDLTTYSVLFTAVPGVTVTADQGTVDQAIGTITGIPTGTNVIITTSYTGCTEDRVVTVTAPLCLSSGIAILKDGVYEDSNNDGIVNIGDTVLYTFEVSNTGDTDLTNITVTDPKVTVVGGPIDLATGETDATSFTASYMITQADIDAGGAYNLATVTGTDPGGDPITETSTDPTPVDPSDPTAPPVDPACPDCTITVIPKETGIAIFKDGIYEDSNNDGIVNIGDTVLYTFEVRNTGETDLTNITVTDPKVTVVGGPIDLATGETDATSFTASYMITQADIDAGGAYNLATVTGTDPGGDPITETSTDPTPVDPSDPTAPAVDPTCPDCTITDFPDEVSPPPPSDATDIAITKEISKLSAVLNEEIVFTVTVTNLGTIEATNIEVSDKLPSGYRFVGATSDVGSNYNEITGILSINSLAPGESVTLLMRVAVLNINDYMNTARLEFLDQEDLDDTNNEASAGSGVVLSNCFEIFNEMTPNNDGKNDYFKIQCIENYPGNTVDIYNRWGIKVYSAKDYQNNWDGTSDGRATIDKGAKLPTGTYYYVIDLNEGDKPLVGWLYIN
ncbi:gliding motility-associated C-terminal domain-containing protein, partial [Joostella sp.]|uniref:DUF7507 domain-containing protein n=1 Tax=Joostella sp. TaxID=2231138 RepID=UPI003A8EF689